MSSEVFLQRAHLLMRQGRSDKAADQLKQLLAQDPGVAEAHAMLSLCMSHDRDQWHDATREAEQAIHQAPDMGFSHYALAVIMQKRKRLPEALNAAKEAIRLDTAEPQYYALAASIHAQQQQWQNALETSTEGLAIDPDSEGCSTIRSLALERLGRPDDALAQANAAVARNPDSAESHAMRGWAQLHSGDHLAAQDSFREALRLDPTDNFARSGMIEALNNNHLLFRLVFRFYSFIGRMAQGAQWAIILGLFFGMRLLNSLADQYPAIEPYVLPISILYLSFCLLSWIAEPLFNTFLRFHPFGKFLLSDKQRWSSNLVGTCIGIGVVGGIIQAIRGDLVGGIIMFLAPVFLSLPISTSFEVDEGWPRTVCIAISVVLTVLCFTAIALIAVDGPWGIPYALFALGIMIFTFAGNYLRTVTVRR
ncbi:tetratricopeptide repeat protein [Aporhodopirellula aestuarii]|uniref:Tetratricopeptide repeat protein n=1 Tax=Aporhodopirellula aestuarii TaxID=2950107 RepID=A0ABT0U7G5_9BACT|nr:tetratricopeptide repeat protein [Aporhodopirellula aestuarii]MCM2372624.1 tetratricopeptide repeat protein [Aporhodopirellula aestuarii]